MWRTLAALLATAVGALTLASAGAAATVTVQIKSTGFSPATITINHDDKVTWHNADKVDHQVVADDGSFASPILHAGPVLHEDAFDRRECSAITMRSTRGCTGKITVKGPPPSVSIALSVPIVVYGTSITLSGTISTGAANQSVELDQQPYGQASPSQLAIVKTGVGGAFSWTLTPNLYTTYTARWNNVTSAKRRRPGRAEDAARSRAGPAT